MHISHRRSCPLFSLSVAVVVVFFPFFRLVFSGPAISALEVVLLPGDRVALSFVFPCVFLPVFVFRSFLLLKIITQIYCRSFQKKIMLVGDMTLLFPKQKCFQAFKMPLLSLLIQQSCRGQSPIVAGHFRNSGDLFITAAISLNPFTCKLFISVPECYLY
jgi:hypothetical protein